MMLNLDVEAIDFLLSELIRLEAEIKPKIKRIEEIKAWCKEIGSFNTEAYVCTVKEQERTCLVGMERVIGALGKDILERNHLIQTIHYQTVHVAEKLWGNNG